MKRLGKCLKFDLCGNKISINKIITIKAIYIK